MAIAASSPGGVLGRILKHSDLLIALAVVMVVVMMVLPLPALLLDILITINLALALTLVLISMYTQDSLELSIFPSLLLFTTLFRLAHQRLRDAPDPAARRRRAVIHAFGQVVVGGNVRRRPRRLPDHRDRPVRGHHEGRRARRRGRRALHPRRHARQADGDRRRPQRRPDHRRRGPRPPRQDPARGGLLRLDGRRLEVRQGRRRRRPDHRRDQPRRRHRHRRPPARHLLQRRPQHATRCSPSATAWPPRSRPC